MFDASEYWITVVELDEFVEAADEWLSPTEIEGLITCVSVRPDDGTVIPDTGGLRIMAWPACGDASPEVIYFFRDLNMPVYLVTVVPAGETAKFTASDKARMRAKVDELIIAQWAEQISPLLEAATKA